MNSIDVENMVNALKELGGYQHVLNEADDVIGERILAIETALRARVSIEIKHRIDERTMLVFGKSDGNWKLLLVDEHDEETPLRSAPRHVRSEMFLHHHIEHLIVGAVEQLKNELTLRKAAISEADRIIQILGGPK